MSKIDELAIEVNCELTGSCSAPHIEIKQKGILTEVFVNDKKSMGSGKVSFEQSCENLLPVLKLELLATDMEVDANVIPELPEVLKPFYKLANSD